MTRILVVEDVPPNVEILKRLLSRKGYDVVVADNKDDAINIMNSEPADLVLMDIGIPNKPGEVVNDNGGLERALNTCNMHHLHNPKLFRV